MLIYEEITFFKFGFSWLKGLLRVFFSLPHHTTYLHYDICITNCISVYGDRQEKVLTAKKK
jgi:hypothetical protein